MLRKLSAHVIATLFVCAPCALADTATFTPLGVLPEYNASFGFGVSNDGDTVVGRSSLASTFGAEATRWNADGAIATLGFSPSGYPHSNAFNTSADGSVTVGHVSADEYVDWRPARYTDTTGWQGLGSIPGSILRGEANDVSSDGSIIVGYVRMEENENLQQAFRWTETTGMVGLGSVDGITSHATAISADGTTIVGVSENHAMRWTEADGMIDLGTLGGSYSDARDVSSDGSVIVGGATSSSSSPSYTYAFRWEDDSMVSLGTLPGSVNSRAYGVSGDGDLIVGSSNSKAFIWDPTNGMRRLHDVLVDDYGLGEAIAGWNLMEATAITPDGSTIVGWGLNPLGEHRGWKVEFKSPDLLGDLNDDNVVDNDDRVAFCGALGTTSRDPGFIDAADLNDDGTIDHLDQQLFDDILPPCPGDVVASDTFEPPPDGLTDGADLAYLLGAWGNDSSCADMVTSGTFAPPPDGVVDGADLAYLLGAWGSCPESR